MRTGKQSASNGQCQGRRRGHGAWGMGRGACVVGVVWSGVGCWLVGQGRYWQTHASIHYTIHTLHHRISHAHARARAHTLTHKHTHTHTNTHTHSTRTRHPRVEGGGALTRGIRGVGSLIAWRPRVERSCHLAVGALVQARLAHRCQSCLHLNVLHLGFGPCLKVVGMVDAEEWVVTDRQPTSSPLSGNTSGMRSDNS